MTAELVRRSAVSLLKKRGLAGFASSVRLDDALALLEEEEGIRLTHGSVYGRIWNDQRHFQLDVVATTIADYRAPEIAEAIRTAVDRDTEGDIGLQRTAAAAFLAASETARVSRQWNLWLGARRAVVSTPENDDDEQLADALEVAREQVISSVADALDDVLASPFQLDVSEAQRLERAGTFVTLLIGVSLDHGSTVESVAKLLPGLLADPDD